MSNHILVGRYCELKDSAPQCDGLPWTPMVDQTQPSEICAVHKNPRDGSLLLDLVTPEGEICASVPSKYLRVV